MARVKPKFKWLDIFNAINCETYNEKGKDFDEGLNCFSQIILFLKETGHEIGELPKDITWTNVVDKWREDDTRVVDIMKRYLKDVVMPISISELETGDIILIKDIKGERQMPSIYCGNGRVFTMSERGAVKLRLSLHEITGVYRGVNV